MSSECTWCALLGFIILPFLGLFLALLPLSLIARLRGVRLALRFRWSLCVGALLLLALAIALRYANVLAWVAAALLYLVSLAVAVVFRARHKLGTGESNARA